FISGALAEGTTEAAQEAWADAMQYLATRDPATFEQFRERLLAAGTLGAAVGGVADVVLGAPPVEPAAPRQPEVEAAQAEAQVAAQAQAEAAAQAAAATAAAAEAAQQAAEAAQQAAEQASAAAQQAPPAPPPAPEAQASAAEQGPPAPPAEPPAAPAPEAPAAAVAEPEVTDALREAARAWMAGEAYADSRGNHHVRRPARTTGPMAPWNRAVKRRFPTVDDSRRFAESIIGTSAVEPQAQPEPAPAPAPEPAPEPTPEPTPAPAPEPGPEPTTPPVEAEAAPTAAPPEREAVAEPEPEPAAAALPEEDWRRPVQEYIATIQQPALQQYARAYVA